MTRYRVQPPAIPQQQQIGLGRAHSREQSGYPAMQQQHVTGYFLPPPQYQHPAAPPAGPHTSYPYPPLPRQPQQYQPFNSDNDGSTTVMLPVTFTPGMAPVIHSGSNRGMPPPLPPPPQQRQQQQCLPRPYPPQFPGIMYSNSTRHVPTLNTNTADGGGSGSGAAASPRYLSMGPPPPPSAPLLPHQHQQLQQQLHSTHHQFSSPPPLSATGQLWPAGAAAAHAAAAAAAAAAAGVPRMSPPPPHPISYSGRDFQATMPSGVTEPLQLSKQHLPAAAAAVGRASTSQPASLPVLRLEEQSGDSAPPRDPSSEDQRPVIAGNRAQQLSNHGYRSQNDDLADDLLNPPPPLPPSPLGAAAAAAGAATGLGALQKMRTAPAAALEALAEAAATAAPEISRASRSSARQQYIKTLKQNEVELTVNGGSGRKKVGGPGNTSEALRKELGAALLGSDTSDLCVPPARTAAVMVDTLPHPPPLQQQQQQQQHPAVPSSVLHNLSRALADLSRMTAGTAPRATAATAPMPPPALILLPTSTSTQAQLHSVGPNITVSPPLLPTPSTLPATLSLPYPEQPPELLPPPGQPQQQQQQQQQLPAPQPPPPSPPSPPPPRSLPPVPRFSRESAYLNHGSSIIPTTNTEAEVENEVENRFKCPACGKRFAHRSSKGRHMRNCKAVTSGFFEALKKKTKKMAPPAPLPCIPIFQFSRPANGPQVSRPLKLEKTSFGPGIFFPRRLKRKRTNMYSKTPTGTAATGADGSGGGVKAISTGYGQQQAQQKPAAQQQYNLPITSGKLDIRPPPPLPRLALAAPPGAAAVSGFAHHHHHQHHQQAYFPATGGFNINQGQMMQIQNRAEGIAPPSLHLPNSNGVVLRTGNPKTTQVPPPSPQPAPSRLQRSSVATTRSEPMVRIVRDISTPSQLQRLQVDAKMERSLLLPPVPGLPLPPPPPPAVANNHQPILTNAPTSTTTAPTTRGSLLSGKAAAAAVALAVGADDQHLNQHTEYPHYPDEFTPLFKLNVTVIDESDQAWSVIYEGLACSGQRHVRLSAGWHAMMKGVGVVPGDKIVLERWTDDRTVLHMLVLEGSDEQRAAAAAGGTGLVRSGAAARAPPPRLDNEGGMDVVNNTTRTRNNSRDGQVNSTESPSKRTRY
ncbi:hypothetical protein NADE_007197 [Nannochloris sp. 'desiccata']|nr:hypothetical protein NADE_007197 [Chlorella desiccata (nom. nud.)]